MVSLRLEFPSMSGIGEHSVGLRNMPKPGIIVEVLLAAGTTAACGAMVVFGSLYGGRALEEFYGDAGVMFSLATRLAISAHSWIPILYGSLMLALLVIRICCPGWRWVTFSVLCVVALAAALVIYGITLPYATTTFSMGP